MRERRPPNPYVDRSLRRLYEACQARAGELMDPPPGPRTPEQRRALALDTGHLLLAVAARIHVSEHVPGSPEQAMGNTPGHLASVYGDYADHLARQARHAVLSRAADYVYGAGAVSWLQTAQVDGELASQLAVGSDAGLRRVLEHLEAVTRAKGWRPPRG